MTLEELGNSKICVRWLEVFADSNHGEVEQVSPARGPGKTDSWENEPWLFFQVQINLGKFDSSNKINVIGLKWEKPQVNLKG